MKARSPLARAFGQLSKLLFLLYYRSEEQDKRIHLPVTYVPQATKFSLVRAGLDWASPAF
jgi:hypothetical protein